MELKTNFTDIYITPRTLQDGLIFSNIDCTDIKDEVYIKYIIYESAHHDDLRIDASSYNKYFFLDDEKEKVIKEIKDNRKIIEAYERKYKEQIVIYNKIYKYLSEKDFYIDFNYNLMNTNTYFIDCLIAKETICQAIYTILNYGSCEDKCYFFNITEKDKIEVDNIFKILVDKLMSIDKTYEELFNKNSSLYK